MSQDKKEKTSASEETVIPEMTIIGNNILQVKNAPVGSYIEIITIVGNKVRKYEIKSANVSFELNLPKAIYIFKLEGTVRKFVIK
jgi:hypothetical protein